MTKEVMTTLPVIGSPALFTNLDLSCIVPPVASPPPSGSVKFKSSNEYSTEVAPKSFTVASCNAVPLALKKYHQHLKS